jgi:hypothetical protein
MLKSNLTVTQEGQGQALRLRIPLLIVSLCLAIGTIFAPHTWEDAYPLPPPQVVRPIEWLRVQMVWHL